MDGELTYQAWATNCENELPKLLPCPFCGGVFTQVRYMGGEWQEPSAFESGYRGECCDCYAITAAYATEAEAIEAWNTRAERTCKMEQVQPPKIMAGWYRCSTCGDVYPPCNHKIASWALQYCPRCGAKVVSE